MADDWKPGDLALCVRVGLIECEFSIHTGKDAPPPGSVEEVVAVGLARDTFGPHVGRPCGCVDLTFASGKGAVGQRCRKINPLTDEEREEAMRDLKLPENV